MPVAVIDKGSKPGAPALRARSSTRLPEAAVRRAQADRGDALLRPCLARVGLLPDEQRRSGSLPADDAEPRQPRRLVSQLGRWLAEQAEEARRDDPPETSGEKLLVTDGRVRGVRTATAAAARTASSSAKFEPGSDLIGQVTVLAEGTQGHLTGRGDRPLRPRGREPAGVGARVKEVWRVAKPLDHVIHTMGWPLRGAAKYREFGGSFIYPMGDDILTIGMVVGLDYRDVELSVHDLLQELKTHPKLRKLLRGGERIAWGAKTIPEGGWYALPEQLHAPGPPAHGRRGRNRQRAARSRASTTRSSRGSWRRRRSSPRCSRARSSGGRSARAVRRGRARSGLIGKDLFRVRNMRQVFEKGFVRGAAAGRRGDRVARPRPAGTVGGERDADQELCSRPTARRAIPPPDGKLTFDKLSSVFLSGNKTRDDAPNHIRIETARPAPGRELWVRMCPRRSTSRPETPARCRSSSRPRTASSAARSPPRAAG